MLEIGRGCLKQSPSNEKKREKLRGGGDQIKSADFGFDRRLAEGFREGGR